MINKHAEEMKVEGLLEYQELLTDYLTKKNQCRRIK